MTAGLIVAMPQRRARSGQRSVFLDELLQTAFDLDEGNGRKLASVPTPRDSSVNFQSLRTDAGHVTRLMAAESSEEEKIFDAKVALKVATAQFAMHLSDDVRARMFDEFDFLLEPEAWDSDDPLPSINSYMQFLKWVIYTKDNTWSSFGIGNEGNILVAWVRAENIMTANFGERIKWTQKIIAEGEPQVASGIFSLEHFARQAKGFLEVGGLGA